MQGNIKKRLFSISYKQPDLTSLIILTMVIAASVARTRLYGDIRLSIASNDTSSYVDSSHVRLFSTEIMTGRRPLTTNLLYKILEPKEGYEILVNGSGDTTRRAFQPGFDRIVILQLILSLLGWGYLAITVAEHLSNPFMKFLGAFIIVVFAFTPQIADWDSVLMSESLTFSMFSFQAAILVRLVFLTYKDPDTRVPAYTVVWAAVTFLWTFLRDTNLFSSVMTFMLISCLFISQRYRKSTILHFMLSISAGFAILGLITSGNSTRSLIQTAHVFESDLLPSPARVASLQAMGMPEPYSTEYQVWFLEKGSTALVRILLIHPGYTAEKIIKDFPPSFTNINQTYFKAPEQAEARGILMSLGNALHPENTTPFLMTALLLIGLIYIATKNINSTSQPWAWLGMWLFLTACTVLFVTILGDTFGLNRHSIFPTMIFRLCMWIFSIIAMDIALDRNI